LGYSHDGNTSKLIVSIHFGKIKNYILFTSSTVGNAQEGNKEEDKGKRIILLFLLPLVEFASLESL
jgi:hypothetical protein